MRLIRLTWYHTFAFLCVPALGCEKPLAATSATSPASRPARLSRAGDHLIVQLSELTPGETNRIPISIADKGEIRLPLIGDLKVANLSTADMEKVIKKAYADAGLVHDCRPSVTFGD